MRFVKDVIHLFYPDACNCCFRSLTTNEQLICTYCRHDLPVTGFCDQLGNEIERTFYGRIPVVDGTSLFYFTKKSTVQRLIHSLKYHQKEKIGEMLGLWLGFEMIHSHRFKKIDCIIPVPLHPKKRRKRGYNQVAKFGKSVSIVLQCPFNERILIRHRFERDSQSIKKRFQRWKSFDSSYSLSHPDFLTDKHILLIDDIITTGATLEDCYMALKHVKGIQVSVACMAFTK